jgi:hypothetical protein
VRIWKYPLVITDVQTLTVPIGARFISAAVQDGTPVVWAEVNETGPKVDVRIEIIGTGNPVAPARRQFIGTILMDPFVWHIYEALQ